MSSRLKMFSDPVHGFISAPHGLICALIETPEVQRLRRIRQLGLGHLVFPGAEHSRFGHALGAMALMHDALQSLQEKGTPISPAEHEAALAVALLHDIGHGPFSHTLEAELINDFHHETMSRALIVDLNERFGGQLDLALRIFDNVYERPFFYQLIVGQLDMDRLDYLRRDAAYTGVSEGVIGVGRIVKTLRVSPADGGPGSRLVVEAKGIYAIESFLVARRMMYWQVYLHKTVLAGDFVLRAVLERYRQVHDVTPCSTSEDLYFFLTQSLHAESIREPEVRRRYAALDDVDVLFSIKQWAKCNDTVLSDLARRFIDRDLFRVTFLESEPTREEAAAWREQVSQYLQRRFPDQDTEHVLRLYFSVDFLEHEAYRSDTNSIIVAEKSGRLQELSQIADTATIRALDSNVVKWYVCYPKEVAILDNAD